MTFNTKDFTAYHITGVDRSGKRFRIETSNAIHALGVNIWTGTVYGVKPDGKRTILKRVYN